MKKIISTVLTALTVISLTGCNKTVASVEAKSTSIEYGKDKVKTVDLLDTENTDSIQGDPEEIDASKVGDVDVSYSSKGKDAGTIHYTVKDTKIPVLKIGEEELSAKTKAKIDQIAPGEAFGLEAVVTLPEGLKDQNLVNEVSVTTLETGEQTKIAQSEIQVKASEEKEQEETTSDIDGETGSEQEESRPASTHPKTGDPYQPLLWLFMIPGSLLAVGWIRSRM